jgi:hypothetical protein
MKIIFHYDDPAASEILEAQEKVVCAGVPGEFNTIWDEDYQGIDALEMCFR